MKMRVRNYCPCIGECQLCGDTGGPWIELQKPIKIGAWTYYYLCENCYEKHTGKTF